jgi:reactive chlorine resistance protein C
MTSISIGMVRVRTTKIERVAAIEEAGKRIVRWGLIVVLAWIGGMKFTAYEAMGIQPLVAHSPLVGWMYDFLSIRSFSAMLGCIEIGTAALISLQYLFPKASAVGAILAIGLFATTLSMVFTTPGWEPTLGFPALSAMPGGFLLKDIVLLGASVWSPGESLKSLAA